MKFYLDPPLTRKEKQLLLVILPPACFLMLLTGYAFGRWLLEMVEL